MKYYYSPAEDSFFLVEIVKNYLSKKENIKQLKCLDIGTGSGIQSQNLLNLKIPRENIIAIDINLEALKQAEKLGIKSIKSNLFQNLKNQTYDLILFNPPYLPENKYDKKSDTTGGKLGDEVIIKFIKQLKNHLTKTGTSFLLTSNQTPEKAWQEQAKKQNLKFKKLATKKLFFEELYIWEITKIPQTQSQ